MTDEHPDPTPADPALAALVARAGAARRRAPVERWQPAHCADLDIRIAADGTWFHDGAPIRREPLVRLFASVLRCDADGRHFLVTPAEKVGIVVEDAPFLAVEMHAAGAGADRVLTVRTNVGDVVAAGPEHPLRFAIEADTGGLKPYILVRGRLEARATRAVAQELADLVDTAPGAGGAWNGVWSGGAFFPIARAEEG